MAYSAGASPLPPPPPSPGASGNRTSQHVVGGMSSNLAYTPGADLLKARQGFNEGGMNSGALNRGFFNGQAPQEALDFSQRNTNSMQAGQGLSGGQAIANTLNQHSLGNIRPANAPGGLGFGRSNSLGVVRQHTLTGNEVTGGTYTPDPTPVAPPPPPPPPPATGGGGSAADTSIPNPMGGGGPSVTIPKGTTEIQIDGNNWTAIGTNGQPTAGGGTGSGGGGGYVPPTPGTGVVPAGTPAPVSGPNTNAGLSTTSTGSFGAGPVSSGPTPAQIAEQAARQREADERALAEQQARLQAEAATAAEKLRVAQIAEAERQRIAAESAKALQAQQAAAEAARVAEAQRVANLKINPATGKAWTIEQARANWDAHKYGAKTMKGPNGSTVYTPAYREYLSIRGLV